MKYVVKLLPVEEEVRAGDIVLYKNKYHCKVRESMQGRGLIIEAPKYSSPYLKDEKKVKYFLCSRDIKLGDKYKSPRSSGSTEYIDVEMYASQPLEGSFKVIGEISPEVSFLSDGDEIDEEDVRFVYRDSGGYVIRKEWYEKMKKFHPERSERFRIEAQIKCKCCKQYI